MSDAIAHIGNGEIVLDVIGTEVGYVGADGHIGKHAILLIIIVTSPGAIRAEKFCRGNSTGRAIFGVD